ncbi:colanic acid biosynthesis acetyltransferase WcaF [Fulvivirga sp. M361]|uniref:WcaF family extracellular polysaccharide biosynthesis acetyltransferase n=1 Tax=Fulvivirga sp. M361 TaxID=2594266 RepID=UPI00117A9208|nr:WcaF family extracellular polysaccharide biosynthesis acetyltransferase [Fulvivirga sp. M361]TRX50235.1 colanic acid biosynthesis acetyltransferase WcaF [Fulvivirga sp. M361]
MITELSKYDNSWYKPGGTGFKRFFWFFVNYLVFKNGLLPFSILKITLLKAFGAKVGKGVNIKPFVNIKYPWLLEIGNYVWIGEGVWIDNLTKVSIGNNVCLSQGAFLLTGNHNYKRSTFDLITKEIVIKEGVWIGAKATVCPGVICESHSILSVGSVATKKLEPYMVYSGNPAVKVKERIIES